MTNLPKPISDLTQAEILVIELGLRTDQQQRRIAAMTKLAEIEEQSIRYAEYLNSPEWYARAQAVKERDGWRCRVCNSPRNLQCHHRTYENLGHEADEDLITLCEDCHRLFHENKRLQK